MTSPWGPPGTNFFLGRGRNAPGIDWRPSLRLVPGPRFPQINELPGRMLPDDLAGQVHHGGVGVDQRRVAGGDGLLTEAESSRSGTGDPCSLDLEAPGGENLPDYAPGRFLLRLEGVIEGLKQGPAV